MEEKDKTVRLAAKRFQTAWDEASAEIIRIVEEMVSGDRSPFRELTPEALANIEEGEFVVATFVSSALKFCEGRGPEGRVGAVTVFAPLSKISETEREILERAAVTVVEADVRDGRLVQKKA